MTSVGTGSSVARRYLVRVVGSHARIHPLLFGQLGQLILVETVDLAGVLTAAVVKLGWLVWWFWWQLTHPYKLRPAAGVPGPGPAFPDRARVRRPQRRE